MVTAVIEGRSIGSAHDIHASLKSQLGFPDHYGHNASALFDCLSRDVERPIHIVWRDAFESWRVLGDAEFAALVATIARAAAEQRDMREKLPQHHGPDDVVTFGLE